MALRRYANSKKDGYCEFNGWKSSIFLIANLDNLGSHPPKYAKVSHIQLLPQDSPGEKRSRRPSV